MQTSTATMENSVEIPLKSGWNIFKLMLEDFLYCLDALMTAWLDIKYFIFVYWIREKNCLIIFCFYVGF